MLLIDGVKYEAWIPKTEDEFEQVVKEHTQDIFSEKSIYLDRKQKLKSLSGIGAIPDGFAIVLGDTPHWHIVELELSSHPPHEHIVPQLSKFTLGIKNPSTQNNLVKAIYEYISGDGSLTLKLKEETKCVDIYKFLSELISQPPILTIIIEKYIPALREALSIFRDYQTKVVEFKTFTREGVGIAVHAHLFERLYVPQVTPEQEGLSAGDVVGFSSINQQNINYHYIDIDMIIRSCFPADKVRFTLETTAGQIHTNVAGTVASGPYIQRNLKEWFDAHPNLKTGDVVSFTVIEPMKKYRLELEKRLA